ncbi:ribosome-associated translation inhibitor RaiA [bacterium]|nr:ribosome-associated translation inhibitor RaiA [bacterium]
MDIIIRGSKLEITEAMESYAKEKISRLEKYLENSDDTHATILVKIHGHLHIVEVTIPLKSFILRAEESKDDFYAAIDTVTDKLERQIRKNKTRIAAKKNKEVKDFAYDYIQSIEEESEEKIVKRKKIEVKPMDEEEAILQMELLGHEFYLYKDIETGEPAVIYKRKDGDYGIIEAE